MIVNRGNMGEVCVLFVTLLYAPGASSALRMLKKGMGVEYTQTAMDDNTWKCQARYTIEESAKKRSRAADKNPTVYTTTGEASIEVSIE